MTDAKEKTKHTPGPWIACNMVHADRGDAMTPEELGEYVANNVRKSIEDGGFADRFLFITTPGENAPDICHVGNGPRGSANARLIAAAPDMLEALAELLDAFETEPDDLMPHEYEAIVADAKSRARAALSKATTNG